MPKAKPLVLVATTSRWFPTARIAVALARSGFAVEAVCPSRHPIASTTVVQRVHSYNGLTPLLSFMAAIAACKPDLIVPGDDIAVRHLYDLYRRPRQGKAALCELIERSIGAPESYSIVYARTAFIEAAKKEGIRSPETATIRHTCD